jgi:glutamate N-acetyltransferase/amino-acid N-acetyltransferase
VVVRGDPDSVGPVARAVANSPLVKTALAGSDPNFGRILQAVGQGLAGRAPFNVDLAVDGLAIVSEGKMVELAYPAEWAAVEASFAAPEIDFEIGVPGDGGEAEVFFSDLTHEYVSINADYTS